MHCPQRAHLESSRRYTSRTSTVVFAPVFTTSQIWEFWILSQTWIQRMHLMHLSYSRIRGNVFAPFSRGSIFSKGTPRILRSLATRWSVQLPEREQMAQLVLCCDRISSTLVFRASLAFRELVRITMPSATVLLQAVKSRS